MKALDLLLLSVATGLLAFTVALFSSDYPRGFMDPATAAPSPAPGGFKAIVLHSSEAHRGLPFHFVIEDGSRGPDGSVTLCGGRGKGSPLPHTSNAECNALALSIAVRPGQTEKQEEALMDLLERLCRTHHIDPADVGAHFEVEPSPDCPPGTWNVAALRDELTRRLKGDLTAPAPDSMEPP